MNSVPFWILTGAVAVATRAVMSPYQKRLLDDASEPEVLFVRDSVALGLFLPVITWTASRVGSPEHREEPRRCCSPDY